jgi:hypothetical protein
MSRGRPALKNRTETLYLKITPELKAELVRVQEKISQSSIVSPSLTDVVSYLLAEGIRVHDEKSK